MTNLSFYKKAIGTEGEEYIKELLSQESTRERGFKLLVNTYSERLYGLIYNMVKTHSRCDDILQESFIKVYQNLDKYRGDSKLYTWIYRITVNETLRELKKNRTQPMSPDDVANKLSPVRAESELSSEQIQQTLALAMETLPPKQRMVFNLRYYEEMKYGDMSKVLSTSEGALKAAYHHAVKKIENYIAKHGVHG